MGGAGGGYVSSYPICVLGVAFLMGKDTGEGGDSKCSSLETPGRFSGSTWLSIRSSAVISPPLAPADTPARTMRQHPLSIVMKFYVPLTFNGSCRPGNASHNDHNDHWTRINNSTKKKASDKGKASMRKRRQLLMCSLSKKSKPSSKLLDCFHELCSHA